MVKPMAHVGIGLEVKDPVAARDSVAHQRGIEHIALQQANARPLQHTSDEVAPAAAKVIDQRQLCASLTQSVSKRAADEAGTSRDAGAHLQVEPCGDRVAAEHLHSLERELIEVLA